MRQDQPVAPASAAPSEPAPATISDTSHMHERQSDEKERQYIEDYNKRQEAHRKNPLYDLRHVPFPVGRPLDLGKQSSLQIHDSRSVKHETNINVIGGGGDTPVASPSIDTADLLGHLQGNSA